MIRLFKDSYKLSLLVTAIFFGCIFASAYVLYALPFNLLLTDGFNFTFFKAYSVVGFTFLLGGLALYIALKSEREVIVYRDRSIDTNVGDKSDSIVDENRTTITLDLVKANLNQATSQQEVLQAGLHTICKQLDAGQGALYLMRETDGQRKIELKQGYALAKGESANISFEVGEGLVGQCASNGETLYVADVPEGYIKIISGLGSASPRFLLIVALKKGGTLRGVMEIASFTAINENQRKFAEESAQLLADKIQ